MDPEADDLYERLGVPPVAPQDEINKKIAGFQVEYGREYPGQKTELERTLKKPKSRREYNDRKGYPTEWGSFDEVTKIHLEGPTVVERDEPVTVIAKDDSGDPLSGVHIEVGGTSLGETDDRGRCRFSFHAPGKATVTASKPTAADSWVQDDSLEIEITTERRNLLATADPASARVGDPVTITVTDDEGPVEGAEIKTPWESERTDSAGECVVTFETKGKFDIDVRKDDVESVTYVSTSVHVEINRRHLTLELSTDELTVTAGALVGFTVTDGSDGISGVIMSGGGAKDTTDRHGRASLEFTEAGTVTVEAKKEKDDKYVYHGDDLEIEVERHEVDLSVEIDDPIEIGEPVTVTVRGGSNPIENADVEIIRGDDIGTTNSSGECQLRFSELGLAKVRATKPATATTQYNSNKASTTVKRASRELEITPSGGSVPGGTPVTFRVVDDAGNRVPGAEIITPSGTYYTEERGTCEVGFENTGAVEITVRKDDIDEATYAEESFTLTVERQGLELAVTTDADVVELGEEIDVVVYDETGSTVKNAIVDCGAQRETTDKHGRCTIELSKEGELEIIANKEDTATARYDEATTSIEVFFEEGELTLDAPEVADATTAATVQVTDGADKPVPGAIVESPVDQVTTGPDGTATVPLPNAEVANLSARKGVEDGIRWAPDTASIDLDTWERSDNGATAEDPSDQYEGLGTAVVLLSTSFLLAIPIVGGLFLFTSDIGIPTLFGVAAVVVISVLLGKALTERYVP